MLDINLGWAGQLGDGRAKLTEVVHEDKTYAQLKGAGPTPYSRTADGFAVLRSPLEIFMCRSHALFGSSTTFAVANAFERSCVARCVVLKSSV
jgi:uncharacterized protein YdiU (UPF0061 family)